VKRQENAIRYAMPVNAPETPVKDPCADAKGGLYRGKEKVTAVSEEMRVG